MEVLSGLEQRTLNARPAHHHGDFNDDLPTVKETFVRIVGKKNRGRYDASTLVLLISLTEQTKTVDESVRGDV